MLRALCDDILKPHCGLLETASLLQSKLRVSNVSVLTEDLVLKDFENIVTGTDYSYDTAHVSNVGFSSSSV